MTREGSRSSRLWLPAPDPAQVSRAAVEVKPPFEPAVEREAAPASRWATPEVGLTRHRLSIPPGAWLVGVELRTAPHRGVVDLRLRYSAADGSDGFTP